MVALSESEVDDITDEFLALMLGEREFIDRWTFNVEQELVRTEAAKVDAPAVTPGQVTGTNKRQETTNAIFEELVHAIDASSQSFLSSVDFAICHCEPEFNRDASLLFAARLQIDRISSKKVDRSRREAGARRLLQLVRLFTTRISSAFQISNTCAFATSLCDMLYTFCDGVSDSINESEVRIISDIRRATDDFNELVVEKLSKATFEANCARKSAATPPRQQFFSPQPAKVRRPLVQIQQRSPGYLLPAELMKKRQKIARSRSQPLLSLPSSQRVGSRKPSYKPFASVMSVTGRGLEHRRDTIAPDALLQQKFARANKEPDVATIRLAKKISMEVMRDLRQTCGKMDIGILGI
ncbi:hypothetical protein RB195_011923 [Necator americanus]|uniref:CLASP N-terminal domain-containing protein n=1 Tax=Necator americanus TaxID=51031 RepID=A0ABR1D6A5_NECAM